MISSEAVTALGVEHAAGKPIDDAKHKERIADAIRTAQKINALAKGGALALNMMRAHVQASAMYGVRVNGISSRAPIR